MDQFQSIESGQGLLKNDYQDDKGAVANALRMRRLKQKDKIEQELNETTEKL